MPGVSEIILDPSIRNWVLFPIFLVMFLQGVLRQYIAVLLKDDKKTTLDAIGKNQLLRRSARLRANAPYISPAAFTMRKRFLIQKAFKDEASTSSSSSSSSTQPEAVNPAQDPMAMVGMMKQNMQMIIPNMLMMGWVSYFFSGFILVKLPFPLTDRFKSMLQRGVGLSSLDVSYVSSLSWYFINLFGLRGVFTMVLGSDSGALDNAEVMAQQMQGGMNQQLDTNKLFEGEKNELEIVQHDFLIPQAEHRLLSLPTAA